MAARTAGRVRTRRRSTSRARSRPFVGRGLALAVGTLGVYIGTVLAPDYLAPILTIVVIVGVGGIIGDHLPPKTMRWMPVVVLVGVVVVLVWVSQGMR